MEDQADALYWARTFPGQSSVSWRGFLPIFRKDVENSPSPHPLLTIDVILAIAFDIGFPERPDAFITADAFAIFIKRFGPLRLCAIKVAENLFSPVTGDLLPWFHGALSRQCAEELLRKNLTAGRYLVRFSEAKPDKFTLVLVSAELKILNVLISNLGEHGYGLKSDYSSCAPTDHFGSIPEFIQRQHQTLKVPEPSSLYQQYMVELAARKRSAEQEASKKCSVAGESLRIAASQMDDPYAVFDSNESGASYPYPTFHTPPAAPELATQESFPLTPLAAQSVSSFMPADDYASFETGTVAFGSPSSMGLTPSPAAYSTPSNRTADNTARYQIGSLVDQATHVISSRSAEEAVEALGSLLEALSLLLPLIPAVRSSHGNAHPLSDTGVSNDMWGDILYGVWIYNCGGLFLLHSGLPNIHSEGNNSTSIKPKLYSSEMPWDNDAIGAVCFPPPSARATDIISPEPHRWKEQMLARILTTRGAALEESGSLEEALVMYQKAIWIHSTLYAEQDLADVSTNDCVIVPAVVDIMSPTSKPLLSPTTQRQGCVDCQVTHNLCSALRQAAFLADKNNKPLLALRLYEEILARACAIGDWRLRESVSVSLTHAHRKVVEHIAPAEYNITSENAKAYLEDGKKEYSSGRTSAAEASLRNGLTCARLCGDREIELKSLCNLATVLKENKKLIEASDLYRQCIALCSLFKQKYASVEKQAMYEMAKCLIDSGLPMRGLAVLDKAITVAESRRNIETLRELKDKTEQRLNVENVSF